MLDIRFALTKVHVEPTMSGIAVHSSYAKVLAPIINLRATNILSGHYRYMGDMEELDC